MKNVKKREQQKLCEWRESVIRATTKCRNTRKTKNVKTQEAQKYENVKRVSSMKQDGYTKWEGEVI